MTTEHEPDPDSKNFKVAQYWMDNCLRSEEQLDRFIGLLKPLSYIYERFLDNGLDETRPDWGDELTSDKELYTGRGGKTLLTLNQCKAAYDFMKGIK